MANQTVEKSKTSSTKKGSTDYLHAGPIDIVKHRFLYIGFSALFLIPSIVFIMMSVMNTEHHAPVRLGIDFTGGTILEYAFKDKVNQSDLPAIRKLFEDKGYANPVVQVKQSGDELLGGELKIGWEGKDDKKASSGTTTEKALNEVTNEVTEAAPVTASAEKKVDGKTEALAETSEKPDTRENAQTTSEVSDDVPLKAGDFASIVSVRSKQLAKGDHTLIEKGLRSEFGSLELLQKNSIGPTLASELFVNAGLGLLLAYLLIVGYLTVRFQFDYAVCAIIALLHDTLIVFGVFAALGLYFQVEVDSLFVTAILTVVGFSVHDTIVVFDRLRENSRLFYSKKLPFSDIANMSVNQTLARSINTSVTTLFPLMALYFFGGETTKHFILAIILGVIVGTYSSICVASMVLTWWRNQDGGAQRLKM